MKKLTFATLFVILISSSAIAQAPQLYAELGGPSLAGLNFDSRFTKSEKGIGGRIGIGGFSIDGTGLLFVPAGLNYLVGKDGTKNFLELGAGVTYVKATVDGESADPDNNLSNTFGHLTLGYRYQPIGSGVTFRVSINPIIAFKEGVFWPFYGGFSVGYKFK